jgi:hypothetical protein
MHHFYESSPLRAERLRGRILQSGCQHVDHHRSYFLTLALKIVVGSAYELTVAGETWLDEDLVLYVGVKIFR